MPNQSRRPLFYWFVVCTIPLYAALWLFSGHVLIRDFHHSKAYGWTLAARDTGWVFTTVDENGPAARTTSMCVPSGIVLTMPSSC